MLDGPDYLETLTYKLNQPTCMNILTYYMNVLMQTIILCKYICVAVSDFGLVFALQTNVRTTRTKYESYNGYSPKRMLMNIADMCGQSPSDLGGSASRFNRSYE